MYDLRMAMVSTEGEQVKKIDKDAIENAMQMVEEAKELVEQAVEGTSIYPNYRAYGRYGFDQLMSNGNPYDSGLQDLIDEAEKEEEEDWEDDSEEYVIVITKPDTEGGNND